MSTCKKLKSRMNSLGNQANDRKYHKPSTAPTAWHGEIIHTDTTHPMKSTTGKKWGRFRAGLQWVQSQLPSPGHVETSELWRIAGLGVNVTKAYPEERPFLKGFFNAMEAFEEGRDPGGWHLDNL